MVIVFTKPFTKLRLTLSSDRVHIPHNFSRLRLCEKFFKEVELPLVELVGELDNLVLGRLLRKDLAHLHNLEGLAHRQVQDFSMLHGQCLFGTDRLLIASTKGMGRDSPKFHLGPFNSGVRLKAIFYCLKKVDTRFDVCLWTHLLNSGKCCRIFKLNYKLVVLGTRGTNLGLAGQKFHFCLVIEGIQRTRWIVPGKDERASSFLDSFRSVTSFHSFDFKINYNYIIINSGRYIYRQIRTYREGIF